MISHFSRLHLTPIICMSLGLAGCGGSSSSPAGVEPLPYQIAEERLSALKSAQDDLRINPASIATSLGSARYTGVILFSSDQTAGDNRVVILSGDLELVVDLSRTENSVEGAVTNLESSGGDLTNGTLSVNSGSVDTFAEASDGYSFSASLAGDLNLSNGNVAIANGGLEGDFLGNDRDQINGLSYLQLTTDRGMARFVGQFAAEE